MAFAERTWFCGVCDLCLKAFDQILMMLACHCGNFWFLDRAGITGDDGIPQWNGYFDVEFRPLAYALLPCVMRRHYAKNCARP